MDNQNHPQKNSNKDKKTPFVAKTQGANGLSNGPQRQRRHKNQHSKPKIEAVDTKAAKAATAIKPANDKKIPHKQTQVAQTSVHSKKQPNHRSQEHKIVKRKNFQKAETVEDIKRDLQRIEKEIWLEISDIASLTLD